MLILEQLQLSLETPYFTSHNKVFLRLSYNNITSIIKSPCIMISQKQLKWQSSMEFPIIYGKDIEFQIFQKFQGIFNKHNKDKMHKVLFGRLNIKRGQRLFNQNVYKTTTNQKQKFNIQKQQTNNKNENKNQVIGKLQISIRNTSIITKQLSSLQPRNQLLSINSIIAHIPELKSFSRVYINISVGNSTKQTNSIKSRGGQLVFLQHYVLDISSYEKNILFQVYCLEEKANSNVFIADGTINLDKIGIQRMVNLTKGNGNHVGQIFIQARIGNKRMPKDQAIDQVIEKRKQFLTIDPSRVQRYKDQSSQVSSRRNSVQKQSQSPQVSRISSILQSSQVSHSTSRIKRISILSQNSQILFAKQPRFQSFHDKPTNLISYLQNKNGLEFKEIHSGKYYKGAHIGKGDKVDFATKGSPGVGEYRLPSIWDRY